MSTMAKYTISVNTDTLHRVKFFGMGNIRFINMVVYLQNWQLWKQAIWIHLRDYYGPQWFSEQPLLAS